MNPEKNTTNIWFELEGEHYIKIMRNGKQIGQIWTEQPKDGMKPYPHEESEYCKNAVQICGFDKISEIWGCGPFQGKKDVVISFLPEGDYFEEKKKRYASYIENKYNKKEFDTIQNFVDWNAHNI